MRRREGKVEKEVVEGGGRRRVGRREGKVEKEVVEGGGRRRVGRREEDKQGGRQDAG